MQRFHDRKENLMTTAVKTRAPNSGIAPAAPVTLTAPATPDTTESRASLRPVSGLLDVTRRGPAVLRTGGFRASPDDVSVPASLIKQYDLRPGDHLTGTARPADTNRNISRNPRNNKTKTPTSTGTPTATLATVDTVNGAPAARTGDPAIPRRPHFDELTPVHPDERLRLEAGSSSSVARIVDLIAPIGKGQRGLIVAPPKAGKTLLLKAIAHAITTGTPEAHLMLVLVGERPEEVTDLRRSVDGEVIASTFDKTAEDHILVAELAIERAKRLTEEGRDVVVLLDSITRLARAYNLIAPATSRILAGGVATAALQPPRTFLGAARNLEDGGSLTILSTALIDTGSRMDDVFFEEFKGTGNLELRLRRDLAEKRLYPAIDVAASGTRRDDLLMTPDEHAAVGRLRRGLAGLEPQQALELLLERTRTTSSNAEFLRQIQLAAS
jgi:transcription termination factor Rho